MRQKLHLTLFLALATLLPATAQNYVTVYEDCDYRGSSHRLYEGDHYDSDLGVGNDKISAIRIPRGWEVTVYTDNNFRGDSQTFDENVSCMPANINDKISSIRVTRSRYSGGGSGNGVTLYVDCDYRGGYNTLGTGRHNAEDLGIGNDRLSSIRVPRGYRVILYTDNNQRGERREIDNDVSCLTSIGMNDKVSSILVERGSGGSNRPSYGNQGSGQVTLYKDCDYRGTSLRLGVGSYDDRDLARIGNDQLSSLRVPRGYRVELYTDNNQRGERAVFTTDIKCLPQFLNDRVSSLRISRL